MSRIIRLLAVVVILSAISCDRRGHDPRLEKLWAMVSRAPEDVMKALDSIDPASLSEKDRAFYNLLTIKANDKAFVIHTSDSLILSVIDYAESHQNEGYYPEALYYGARVYRELGDYPMALDYFHKALDFLPPDTKDQELRSRVVSQTGGLLNDLRLYDEAVPYIIESIEYDRHIKDTVGEVYDLQLLGHTHLRANRLQKADSCFHLTMIIAKDIGTGHHIAKSKMYIAGVKKKLGEIDSALFYINNILDSIKPLVRNSVLAYGSQIYESAGIYDTAYIYAHQLINSPEANNKKIGYEVIFSDSVQRFVSTDSLRKYAIDYHNSIEQSFDEHKAQLAMLQQSAYNYRFQQRQKEKAEGSNRILKNWIVAISFVLLISTLIILWLKNHSKKTIIELRAALENITLLEQSLKNQGNYNEITSPDLSPISPKETAEELRDQLRNRLQELYKSTGDSKHIPLKILQSTSYVKLQHLIKEEKELKENDPLWKELEETVVECSPKFKEHLQLLVGGTLSSFDLHTSLLIKCGVAPSQMAILLNRTKGTIVSRRESICIRIFDKKLGTKTIDSIIRLL